MGDCSSGDPKLVDNAVRLAKRLSLAFQGALALGQALPRALASGATRETLSDWEKGEARRFANIE